MGVLSVPQPQIQQRRSVLETMLPTVLEMLLRKKMERSDAERAEEGANRFLREKQGLPQEDVLKYPNQPSELEGVLGTTPAAKKEVAGLPTPPEKSYPELSKVLQPEAAAPLPPVQGPPALIPPKQMVATGQPASHYSARILQEERPEQLSEYTDEQGNRTLVPRIAGTSLGIKPAAGGLTRVETTAGISLVPKKAGPVMDPITGQIAQSRNLRVEGIQESQKGSFANQYDETIGRTRPFSRWELRQRLEGGGAQTMPASPAEAAKVMAVAGRLPAIYNAAENTREAAKTAILTRGKLSFDQDALVDPQSHTTLGQMASLIARLTHSNDVVDSNLVTSYMHGLVNAAMDQETRNYANHLLTLYEAGVGANSIIGGSNQTSDMRYRALLAALPSPIDMTMEDISGKLNRFETDVALSTSSLPTIRAGHGYTIRDINKDLQEIHEGKPYAQSLIAKLAGAGGVTTATPGVAGTTPQPTRPATAPVTPAAGGGRVRRFRADGTEY